jgi:hypothetical protein
MILHLHGSGALFWLQNKRVELESPADLEIRGPRVDLKDTLKLSTL